jgi:regulator of replication initiation timing
MGLKKQHDEFRKQLALQKARIATFESLRLENEKLRKDMGKKAYEKVLRDFTVKNSHEEKYYQYLKNIIQINLSKN